MSTITTYQYNLQYVHSQYHHRTTKEAPTLLQTSGAQIAGGANPQDVHLTERPLHYAGVWDIAQEANETRKFPIVKIWEHE